MEDGKSIESEQPNSIRRVGERVFNEYIWSIGSLIATLRPIHNWITGNRAKIEKGDRVLEVGAGYPLYKLYSDRVGEDGVFISLDINPNIQKRNKKLGYWLNYILRRQKQENLVTADAGKLPFADATFDVVIASNFTGGNKDYIRETYRVLKPGGRFVTAFLEPLTYPKESGKNAKACEEAGFKEVKLRPGLPGYLPLIPPYLINSGLIGSLIVSGLTWNWDVIAKKPESTVEKENTKVSIVSISDA